MAILDKLKFWKKEEEPFVELGRPGAGYGVGGPGPAGWTELPGVPAAELPGVPPTAGPAPGREQLEIISKNLEILSSKLDALRAQLDAVSQRLANIEASLGAGAARPEERGWHY